MSTQPRRTTRVPSSTSISSIPAGNSKILRQSTNNIPSSQSQQTSLRSNDNPSTRTDLPLPPNKLSRPPSAASALSSLSRTSSRMDMNGGNAAKGRTRAESRAIVMPEREKENGDVNIEVVVRCRGRSPKEIAEKSPIIVTTTPSSPTVTLETTAPSTLLTAISSSATILPNPKRTYSVDKVFGPEADQEDIYNQVVQEAVDEVLMGYNCTIFAYGQTGTGKTHTMQGDLTLNPDNTVSYDAGIIPRTLHSLFHYLDSNPLTEYSVKLSYVELYNEEIRDLLVHGSSPAAPFGSAGGAGNGAGGGLKIFDDQKGKGVLIQGVEERGIENAKSGLNLLKIGSDRRETGETLMNKASSRSHSIFTITVHLKETSPTGEDLLKIGKFNLVDLAGSENVGRSGAEGDRAAEAGMINKSLLTLGRVINALVEKSRHIPYRESKLTRLLQDSLGGRTKTRIIATISPSRSNLEETISTLDYAMRATRIMNRPEMNQRMTKNSLIRDYVLEIERLKADLTASREKNGVYKSEQEWLEWENEKALRETEAKEALHKSIQLESKLHSLKLRLDDQLALFVKKESELGLAKEEISRRVDNLVRKEEELMGVKAELEVEVDVGGTFAEGERRLDGVASELKGLAKQAVGDLEGVFGKLARKGAVMSANEEIVTSHGIKSLECTQTMASHLETLQNVQRQTNSVLFGTLEEFKQRSLQGSTSQMSFLDESAVSLSSTASNLGRMMDQSNRNQATLVTLVQSENTRIQGSFQDWASGWKSQIAAHVHNLEDNVSNKLKKVHGPLRECVKSFDELDSAVSSFLEIEARAREAERERLVRQRKEDAASLQVSLSQFSEAFEAETASSTGLRSSLLSLVNNLFDERDSVSSQQFDQTLAQHQALSQKLEESHVALWEERRVRELQGKKTEAALKEALKEGRKRVLALREKIPVLVSEASRELSSSNQSFIQQASSSLDSEMQEVEVLLSDVSKSAADSSEMTTKVSKKQKIALDDMLATAHHSTETHRRHLVCLTKEIDQTTTALLTSQTHLDQTLSTFETSQSTTLAGLRQSTEHLLSNYTDDAPTGSTPLKKHWAIREDWQRTGSREDVRQRLFDRRLRHHSSPGIPLTEAGIEEDLV